MDKRAVEKYGTLYPMSKDSWGEGFVYLRGSTYWVQYSINGRRKRESAKTDDKGKAEKYLRRKLSAAERGDAPATKTTIGNLLENLVQYYELNRPKSAWWARMVVNVHLKKPFEYMRADRLTTEKISEYTKSRIDKGRKGSTINRELAILRRAYSLGMQTEPPMVSRIPRIPELTEPAARAGFFEAADFRKLCAELPEELRGVAVFAYWTGCRKAEILGLNWAQVDMKERLVRLDKTKNGESRDIPMSGKLLELLTRLKSQRDADWPWCGQVFSRQGKQIRSYYTAWRSACERAQLGNDAKLLHDLRRTGVRNLIRAGVPEKVAMLISGHKTRSVFDRYHIVAVDDVREAMKRLEAHLGEQDK